MGESGCIEILLKIRQVLIDYNSVGDDVLPKSYKYEYNGVLALIVDIYHICIAL